MISLSETPIAILAIIFVVVPTTLAMIGPALLRRRFHLENIKTNNEVAGFKFATVGVLYAVMLAFAVIVVWERFSDAEKSVAQEAGALATVFRLAKGFGAPSDDRLKTALSEYTKAAIELDWPAMEKGKGSPQTRAKLDAIYAALLAANPVDQRGAALMYETLRQLDEITEARRVRLVLAAGAVPGVLWIVLIGGAVLTVGFTLFFGTLNLRAQMAMTGALALLTFSGLFIIVAIDHPFTGSVKVQPEALEAILAAFSSE